MFVDIKVDAGDLQAVLRKLAVTVSPVGITSFLEGVVEPWQEREIASRFLSEHDPQGRGWEPLHWLTQEEREAEGYGRSHPILQRTGALFEYMTSGGETEMLPVGAAISFPRETADRETQEKFMVNQVGTMNDPGGGWRVPARPMLGWVPQDLATTMLLLETWVWGNQ